MIKILAVAGPTASGKSALALELARRLNGEIISCDSMQIYRGMDIGTAKPTAEEMSEIPHHMIDICEPEENYTCADYAAAAKPIIADIADRGKLPIFCGGTGLYLDSVLKVSDFAEGGCRDDKFRSECEDFAKEFGNGALHDKLKQVDFESARVIHQNNVRRVIRALEIYHTTGITKSEWDRRSKITNPVYDAKIFALFYRDRQILYNRINQRVDIMIEAGLEKEVRTLFENGKLPETGGGAQAIGYKEMLSYIRASNIDSSVSIDFAAEEIKMATRRYAKRQITWFSRSCENFPEKYYPVYCDEGIDIENLSKQCTEWIMNSDC